MNRYPMAWGLGNLCSSGPGRFRKAEASVATVKSAKERVEGMGSEKLGDGGKSCKVQQVTLGISAFTLSDSEGNWGVEERRETL